MWQHNRIVDDTTHTRKVPMWVMITQNIFNISSKSSAITEKMHISWSIHITTS